jgi:hypothetical protein
MSPYCGKCGILVPEESNYCLKCGQRILGPPVDPKKFEMYGLLSILLGAVFITMGIYGAISGTQDEWRIWWRAFFLGIIVSFAGAAMGLYSRLVGKNFMGSIGFYMNLIGYPILFSVTYPIF